MKDRITASNWRKFDYKELSNLPGQAMGDMDVGIWDEVQRRKERAEQVKTLTANLNDENIRTLQTMLANEVDPLIEREILIALRNWARRRSVLEQIRGLLGEQNQDLQTTAKALGKIHYHSMTLLLDSLSHLENPDHKAVVIYALAQSRNPLDTEQVSQILPYVEHQEMSIRLAAVSLFSSVLPDDERIGRVLQVAIELETSTDIYGKMVATLAHYANQDTASFFIELLADEVYAQTALESLHTISEKFPIPLAAVTPLTHYLDILLTKLVHDKRIDDGLFMKLIGILENINHTSCIPALERLATIEYPRAGKQNSIRMFADAALQKVRPTSD